MAKSCVDQGVTSVVAAPGYDNQDTEQLTIQMHVDEAERTLAHSIYSSYHSSWTKGNHSHDRLVTAFEQNTLITVNRSTKYVFLQIQTNTHLALLNKFSISFN